MFGSALGKRCLSFALIGWTPSVIGQRFSPLHSSFSSFAGFTLLFVVAASGATFWAVRWWVGMLQARKRDAWVTRCPTQSFSPTRSPHSHDERDWCYSDQAVMGPGLSIEKSVPSIHMRCNTTASRRARATLAFLAPRR